MTPITVRPALIAILALAAAVAGCGPTFQATSGKDYLARTAPVPDRPTPEVTRTVLGAGDDATIVEDVEIRSTDDLVRDAASVEPLLRMPARFGLARIDGGRLTTIPAGEMAMWRQIAERQRAMGTFVALDPFLADYVVKTVLPNDRRALARDARDVITTIRLGAARQHLDAVLIYEVGARRTGPDGIDGLWRLTVLGDAPLPARPIETEGIARAFLMDVRNGYPYGVASASVDLEPLARSAWDSRPDDPDGIAAKAAIVQALAPEVEAMMTGLAEALRTRVAAK